MNTIYFHSFILISALNAINAYPDCAIQFQSENFPDRFIRHEDFVGKITQVNTADALSIADSSFVAVPCLAGNDADCGGDACISLKSVSSPGFFLRHISFDIKLQKQSTDINIPLFNLDASFCVRDGLVDSGVHVSFESVNFPNYYIRHLAFILYLDEDDNSPLFARDASFLSVGCTGPELEVGQNTFLQSVQGSSLFIRHQFFIGKVTSIDTGSAFDLSDALFSVVDCLDPNTLNCGDDICVSFLASDGPGSGQYLRHQDFQIKLNPNDSSALFAAEASFCVRDGLADDGQSISFQSVNFPDYYIARKPSTDELWIRNDPTGDGVSLYSFNPIGVVDVGACTNAPPTAVCMDTKVFLDGETGTVLVEPDDIDGGSTDDFGIESLNVSPAIFDECDLGKNVVELEVTDIFGLTSTCSATVKVKSSSGSSKHAKHCSSTKSPANHS